MWKLKKFQGLCEHSKKYKLGTGTGVLFKATKGINLIDSLQETTDIKKKEQLFKKIRLRYKIAEAYAAYLNLELTNQINGPAIPWFDEDNLRTLPPVGLQKIEEIIFEDKKFDSNWHKQLSFLKNSLKYLTIEIEKFELNSERYYIATHQQLLSLTTLSLSGFDTPLSKNSLRESKNILLSLKYTFLKSFASNFNKSGEQMLVETLLNRIDKAVVFLNKSKNFEEFDRFTFIREYINPITSSWANIGKQDTSLKLPKYYPLNFETPTFSEKIPST